MGIFDKLFGGGNKNKNTNTNSINNVQFTVSGELMDDDQFWKIIQKTKDNSHGNFEQQQEELAAQLKKLTPSDIILFDNRFSYYRGAAYSWELWGAIYIIHGGCSDDSFNDFREWVIAQGRDFYQKTIKNPESLINVDKDEIENADWEGLGYIPPNVFKELTGQEMPNAFMENREITGIEWKEEGDDLKRMFPELYAKYSGNT